MYICMDIDHLKLGAYLAWSGTYPGIPLHVLFNKTIFYAVVHVEICFAHLMPCTCM